MLLAVFVLVYAGMLLGRLPGLQIDRTGIALLGAIALVLGGVVDTGAAVAMLDLPTLLLLFSMMVPPAAASRSAGASTPRWASRSRCSR